MHNVISKPSLIHVLPLVRKKRNHAEPDPAVAAALEEDWGRDALVENMELDMNLGGNVFLENGRRYSRFGGNSQVIIM